MLEMEKWAFLTSKKRNKWTKSASKKRNKWIFLLWSGELVAQFLRDNYPAIFL